MTSPSEQYLWSLLVEWLYSVSQLTRERLDDPAECQALREIARYYAETLSASPMTATDDETSDGAVWVTPPSTTIH
ncbi:MAG: hypothetical protein ACO3FT_04915 [Ilumatobacteraceae bacterium]